MKAKDIIERNKTVLSYDFVNRELEKASDYLAHHGIIGQKWGVRRYQNSDGSLTEAGKIRHYNQRNMRNAETQHLDKFGTDKDHNILYISGKSGSGKSTAALALADKNTSIIHLDSYFELKNKSEANKNKNKEFNNFLKKNGFDINSLNDGKLFKNNVKAYFKKVDRFAELSEEFGREEFKGSRKVIMEGVQLLDDTMYPNKRFFDNKPCILLKTSDSTSRKRAKERDPLQ